LQSSPDSICQIIGRKPQLELAFLVQLWWKSASLPFLNAHKKVATMANDVGEKCKARENAFKSGHSLGKNYLLPECGRNRVSVLLAAYANSLLSFAAHKQTHTLLL